MNTNKSKHTPGPWKYNKGEPGYFPTVSIPWEHPDLYPDSEDKITVNAGNGPHERHEANARLIASVPELLAALERVLECHRLKISLDTNAGAVEQARAAIAKAKGK